MFIVGFVRGNVRRGNPICSSLNLNEKNPVAVCYWKNICHPTIWQYKKEATMRRSHLFRFGILLSAMFLMNLVPSSSPLAEDKPQKSLYERLGGVYNIAPVVDEFLEVLYDDDILNANPKIKAARNRVSKAYLKYHVTSLVCQSTGGPEKYTGRGMKESHQHLDITEKEWQAMGADFKKVLDKFKVPEQEQKELFAIVETTKKDIVISPVGKKQ
jgi:hemoglobin